MSRLVFLLEEPSMREVLEILLPRLLPEGVDFQLITHQGKSDLEKSIPRKLRGWRTPNDYFVILRDNDNADCKALKAKLRKMCVDAGKDDVLIRIVCQELEAWFLGDLRAVGTAYAQNTLSTLQEKGRFRNPDRLVDPFEEIGKLISGYAKLGGARAIAPHLDITSNRSRSFQVFVEGVQRLTVRVSKVNETANIGRL